MHAVDWHRIRDDFGTEWEVRREGGRVLGGMAGDEADPAVLADRAERVWVSRGPGGPVVWYQADPGAVWRIPSLLEEPVPVVVSAGEIAGGTADTVVAVNAGCLRAYRWDGSVAGEAGVRVGLADRVLGGWEPGPHGVWYGVLAGGESFATVVCDWSRHLAVRGPGPDVVGRWPSLLAMPGGLRVAWWSGGSCGYRICSYLGWPAPAVIHEQVFRPADPVAPVLAVGRLGVVLTFVQGGELVRWLPDRDQCIWRSPVHWPVRRVWYAGPRGQGMGHADMRGAVFPPPGYTTVVGAVTEARMARLLVHVERMERAVRESEAELRRLRNVVEDRSVPRPAGPPAAPGPGDETGPVRLAAYLRRLWRRAR